MVRKRWFLLAMLLAGAWPTADALATDKTHEKSKVIKCGLVDRKLHGTLEDFTFNHGVDRRIWSRALYEKRDLYVYLPPGYDCNKQYPVMIYLHGFATDEQSFLNVMPVIDEAIAAKKLPPLIVAAPDGSLDGQGCLEKPGSFWINSNAGCYEDFVLQDVWDFLTNRYSICHDRDAHVLAGISMGGFGAFNLGIRHREAFGVVIGVMPPV